VDGGNKRPNTIRETERFATSRDTPTVSGEINTTQRHHFRPPRAAVFNRRQQRQRVTHGVACPLPAPALSAAMRF
jgi:hypothetical protein